MTRQGSSVDVNFAIIHEIIDTPVPAYLDYKDGTYFKTWDRAYKLKIKRLENKNPFFPDVFQLARPSYNAPIPTYDEARTATINVVDRVVKVDLELDIDGR